MENTLFVYPLNEVGTRLRDERNTEPLFQFRRVSQFRQDLEKTSPVTRNWSVIAVSHRFTLEIALVPKRLEIAPNRWHITIIEGEERWTLPVQFTEIEARSLLPRIEGEPKEIVMEIVQNWCDRGGEL